ncbi:MAG: lysophospholipid acyltransferase family protein [Planctomycetales bacterium]|nr:lysophospholipid acyltransferase family protein [Planctomycetales bacterium]
MMQYWMREAADLAAYLAVRATVCVIQSLPLSVCAAGADAAAHIMWSVLRLRRKVVDGNLQIAFPDASQGERAAMAVGMWRHLFLMVCEVAHAPRKVRRSNWKAHSSIEAMEPLVRQLLSPRPTVIISGHLGNFEMGGYLLGVHGFQTHTIARPLDNRRLGRWVDEFRGATGQHILPKDGSGPQIAHLLEQGGTLVLLGDQFAHGHACWVDFFGKPAATHKAVAVFTLSGAAPTSVCAVLRNRSPLHFRMLTAGLVDPQAADFELGSIPLPTQWYTQHLEELIRHAPDQYWWVHRRWKGAPPAKRRRGAPQSPPAPHITHQETSTPPCDDAVPRDNLG